MGSILKSYSDYKPSGIKWLGDVPSHWEQLPGRACYYEKKLSNTGMRETTVLSLSYGQIVVKPVEQHHGLVPASFETYQVVEPGDIIIRPTDLQNDWTSLRFGLSRHHGTITSAYMCFRTRGVISREYGHLLLHTYDLMKIFYGLGSGLRQNLNWRDFEYLPCLVPPLTEQTAIIRYVDHIDERIRHHISAKERLISLLDEQRQIVIHRVVTRGLDPNVHLKPSGVKWLGDVPSHWEVRRLKHVAALNPSRTESRNSLMSDTSITFLPMERVWSDGRIDPQETLSASKVWNGFTYFRRDDILVAKITPCFENGKGAHLQSLPTEIGFGSTEFHVLRAKSFILPQFLYRLTTASEFRRLGTDAMTGAAGQQRVPSSFVANYSIPLPPLPEQTAIVEYLDKATTDIEAAIDRARREIELLKEYRTRLIADVVTGKLDVREATFKLPKESDKLNLTGAVDDVTEMSMIDDHVD